MKSMPKVSTIIVSFNNEVWVEQCLDSLLNQNYENLEVIWVDNGSVDKTVELVKSDKYSSLNIILKELKDNTGFAVGNNIGLESSTGDIIFLLNSDAQIEPNVINQVVAYMKSDEKIGIVQNTMVMMDEPTKFDSIGSQFTSTGFLDHLKEEKNLDEKNAYSIFSGKGASLFISRKLLSETYLFNPKFVSYFEDTDVCWRAWLLGYKVKYLKTDLTLHKGGATGLLLQSGRTDFYSFKNRLLCLHAYLELQNLIKILPLHLAVINLVILTYLFKRQWDKAFAVIKANWWFTINFRYIMKLRREFQTKRKVSDKHIFEETLNKLNLVTGFKSLMGYTSRTKNVEKA